MTDDGFSDKSIGGIIRGAALWVMIGTVAVGDALLYWRWWVLGYTGVLVWAVFWSCIIALVGTFEIWGKFFLKDKRTISNMYRDWTVMEKAKGMFPWSRLILIILWISFTALTVHLWFF